MVRSIFLLLCCGVIGVFSTTLANAQTTNNQGTDFYLGFSQNYVGTPNLVLFLTGSTATTGTVAVPGLSFSTTFSVTPGTITAIDIPGNAESQGSDVIANNGIHVTSLQPVTVYGLNQIPYTTDAFLGLPAPLLGTNYIVLAYTGGCCGPSEFQIVGSQNGTVVTITPSTDATNHPAGVQYKITLNKLQTYQLQATSNSTDLTGTLITSNNPVAVFGASQCTDIPTTEYAYCDYVVEQLPAVGSWGNDFLTVPLETRHDGDTFRVLASLAGTTVTIDGALVATLGAAQFYQTELSSTSNHTINTSNPSLVAQYSNSTTYDGVLSDPMMMLISPTEQFQTSYSVTTPASSPETYTNYINVVAKSSDVSSCKIDSDSITTFKPIGTSGYDGAQIPVSTGTHNLSCPNKFGTYVYGFASFDSYGYPGGLGGMGINPINRCDVNLDGQIDSRDINLIFTARNTPANGVDDPRDADGDLEITVADARVCQQKCTHTACAIN